MDGYLCLAASLEALGDGQGAEAALRSGEQIDPDCAPLQYNYGLMLYERGDLESAGSKFRRAAELDPEDPDAWECLAYVYESQNDDERVREALIEALKRQPERVSARLGLCRLALNAANYEDLDRIARQGLEFDPENVDLLHYLGVALVERGNPAEAVKVLSRAADMEPENDPVAYEHGLALAASGRREDAHRVWSGLLARKPPEEIRFATERMMHKYHP